MKRLLVGFALLVCAVSAESASIYKPPTVWKGPFNPDTPVSDFYYDDFYLKQGDVVHRELIERAIADFEGRPPSNRLDVLTRENLKDGLKGWIKEREAIEAQEATEELEFAASIRRVPQKPLSLPADFEEDFDTPSVKTGVVKVAPPELPTAGSGTPQVEPPPQIPITGGPPSPTTIISGAILITGAAIVVTPWAQYCMSNPMECHEYSGRHFRSYCSANPTASGCEGLRFPSGRWSWLHHRPKVPVSPLGCQALHWYWDGIDDEPPSPTLFGFTIRPGGYWCCETAPNSPACIGPPPLGPGKCSQPAPCAPDGLQCCPN